MVLATSIRPFFGRGRDLARNPKVAKTIGDNHCLPYTNFDSDNTEATNWLVD